ncbi:MAG: GFA family protein [Parvularculaceae bacterium]
MSDPTKLTGRCACGAVTFKATATKSFGVCHCRMCRRWIGGVWMAVRITGEPDIEGPIKIWKSSRIADRANCERCGSAIWHRSKTIKSLALGLGLFDDQTGWEMKRQIFIEQQPDHYGFGSKAVGLTGWATLWALITGKMPN